MAIVDNPGTPLGERAPEFKLSDTTGQLHSLADAADAPATVIYFTCNHCPYAIAWEERLHAVARDYAEQGVKVYAINSNDGERYPADSYAAMQERVSSEGWSHPYLHDASQDVARAFDAKTTPDVFVLDSELRIRYRGAPDADYQDPTQNAQWARDALDQLLAGEEVTQPETAPVGCSVKWKA